MYDSYGKKCNHRFFLNYGFINLNNDANEFPFKIHYNPNDQYEQVKKEMIADSSSSKKFRVTANFEDKIIHEFLSWIRFVEFDENITLMYQCKGQAIALAEKNRR